ncbi:MAG: TetR/AcrR family transcriptional regulator [Mycobacteriaceae bacterium]
MPSTAPPAASATRRRGRPGLDLAQVLAGSIDVFTERGYDGASIDDLSRRLGISKSSIYHHVSGKEALLGLALDDALTGLEAAVHEALEHTGAAVVRLEVLLRGSVAVLVDRLPSVTLLLRVRGNSEVERDALARRRALDQAVAELVRGAVAEGDLRPDVDPVVTARLLFGTVNSLTEWLRPGGRHDATQLADAVLAMAFDGLRARR